MEKRDENKLMEMYQKAIDVMKTIDCDKTLIEIGNIKLNGRLSRTLGRCFMRSGNIEISKEFFHYGKKDDVFETILHELAHRVCMKKENEDGHGASWQYVTSQINKKLGTNITQYAGANKIEYRASLDNGKYATFVCTKCSKQHVVTLSRVKLSPSDIESRYRCNCGGHIIHIKH
jgi:predicted SprT family Zn-dependent metalloprotease